MAINIPRPVQSSFPDVQVPEGASLESFGGGQSTADAYAATGRLANEQARYHQEKLETTLQTAADEELNAILAEEARLTTELQKVKGKDAFAAADQTLKNFDKFKSDREKNIGNPLVKQYVGQKYAKHRMQLEAFGMRYSNAEGERWQDATDSASIEQHRNAAIANGTPERISQAIEDTNKSLTSLSRRKGMPPEWLETQKAEKASAIHFGVYSTIAANGNDQGAKAYFDAHRSEFVGNDLLQATARSKRDSLLGDAFRIADAMFSKEVTRFVGENEVGPPETMDEVRELTGKIEPPELRREVEQQAKIRIAERKSDAIAVYTSKLEDAQDIVERTRSTKGLPAGLRTTHIRELERRAFELSSGEKKVMTDSKWALYNHYMDMAAKPETRDEFLSIPPLEYRNEFPDEQFNDLRSARTGLLKDDKQMLAKMESRRTDTDYINDALSRLDLVPVHGRPLSPEQKRDKEAFERIAREQFTFYAVKNQGKPLDNAIREDVIKKLEERVVTNTHWYGDDISAPGYKRLDQEYNRRITQMEAGEQILIEEALRRAGEPVTRGRVLEIYMSSQRKRK